MQRRVVCFSAYSTNLRATAFTRFLKQFDYEVIEPKPHGPPGSIQELALTLLPYCWFALTCRADLAAGFKPHPNVTLPLLICKLRGIPTWIDVDDLDHAYRTGWVSRLVKWLQHPFPRLFNVVSYHNHRLEDFLTGAMRCRPERLLRIQQGVDYQFFNTAPAEAKTEEIRRRHQLAGRRVAVYTAHLNVASDLEPVLTAWQKVPDGVLLVVGGGPLLDHYRQMAVTMGLGERVQFTGEVSHADIPAYFALADVALLYFSGRLVNAYRCSLKLREYFAAGLKIVCNDFGELGEYTRFTYQTSSDLSEFAAMIARVLQGHGDGREQAARQFAREHLDWPQLVAGAADEIARRVECYRQSR